MNFETLSILVISADQANRDLVVNADHFSVQDVRILRENLGILRHVVKTLTNVEELPMKWKVEPYIKFCRLLL